MALSRKTSTVQVSVEKFALAEPEAFHEFIDLGKAGKGRHHFAIFDKPTVSWDKLSLVPDASIKYTPDCVQYYIQGLEDTVIGSLFVVNRKTLSRFDTNTLVVGSDDDEDFTCPIEIGNGGVNVFRNKDHTVVAVPSEVLPSPFLVMD